MSETGLIMAIPFPVSGSCGGALSIHPRKHPTLGKVADYLNTVMDA